jgi:transmembrane sensor
MTMNDDLLVKHLLGEASPEESAAVETWIAASSGNARTFRDFKTIWDQSRHLAIASDISVDAAWDRFQELRAADAQPQRAIPFRLNARVRIAAAIALLITCGIAFWLTNQNTNRMLAVHSAGAPLADTLPDGSIVTLNKGATLHYPEHFEGGERNVTLDGEAFFEVAPDKSHPFIIAANDTRVRVVGTSFNVATGTERTEVIVATGVVEVSRAAEAVRLQPREAATVYQGRAGIVKRQTDDLLYNYYRTHEFVCVGTPLSRLVEVLQQAYDVEISIPDPALRNMQLTATFKDESLRQVLDVITATLGIHFEQSGKQVTLKR